jgi:hypothetical protein
MKKIIAVLLLFLFIVTVASAQNESIILSNDHTTEYVGIALVFCSLAGIVVAVAIILKILTSLGIGGGS